MIDEKHIASLVDDYLGEGSQFVVSIRVTPQNKIMVFIDGDHGVTIDDCVKLSRHIEQQLDRDTEDFELEVSSVGVGHPLQLPRQYRNNIGRRLAILDVHDRRVRGKLSGVESTGITIEKDKPSKAKKKKKEPETDAGDSIFIPFEDIREAKVQVSFR